VLFTLSTLVVQMHVHSQRISQLALGVALCELSETTARAAIAAGFQIYRVAWAPGSTPQVARNNDTVSLQRRVSGGRASSQSLERPDRRN
jgi:hypothetical protein